jgi:hypothetical protein
VPRRSTSFSAQMAALCGCVRMMFSAVTGHLELWEPPSEAYDGPMSGAAEARDLIVGVSPLEGRKVRVTWQSGLDEVLDLRPVLVRFAQRPVVLRELLFRTVAPGADGLSISWDDGSEVGVSWLRDLALASMTNSEFREALAAMNITIEEAAAHLGVSKRSIAGYRTNRAIPRAISMAVRFLLLRRQPKS